MKSSLRGTLRPSHLKIGPIRTLLNHRLSVDYSWFWPDLHARRRLWLFPLDWISGAGWNRHWVVLSGSHHGCPSIGQ